MAKPAKKQDKKNKKKQSKKNKIINHLKLVKVEADRSAPEYLTKSTQKHKQEMFEDTVPAGSKMYPNGQIVTPLDSVKSTFAYQDLLKKYRRQAQKAHNKRGQLKSVQRRAQQALSVKDMDILAGEMKLLKSEWALQFALKLLNRARNKAGLSNLSMEQLKLQYERSEKYRKY